MDKFQTCPNPECDQDWDGGEIINNLMAIDAFVHRNEKEIEALATGYGWTPDNRKHFTNVIMHTINGELILECPSCRKAWEDSSGMEFESMLEAKEVMP